MFLQLQLREGKTQTSKQMSHSPPTQASKPTEHQQTKQLQQTQVPEPNPTKAPCMQLVAWPTPQPPPNPFNLAISIPHPKANKQTQWDCWLVLTNKQTKQNKSLPNKQSESESPNLPSSKPSVLVLLGGRFGFADSPGILALWDAHQPRGLCGRGAAGRWGRPHLPDLADWF